ncbi:LysR family transcriptional regulator [Mycobacterium sp. 21AC1]|uniref:LysR family transcriptional regulator n=1 Tax=[Mycobacterium] appelbergii TaxID=2939269 RepID=UPI002938EFB5|nr:LysR family transcriptional regulator [Mycobacterium sp. 21AC1]MDV3127181.1 LysR family transcriptional regulator [Mycobacterium sp. 21AC1]
MDTRLLRSFLSVAHAGSFTEAALELGFTQSTVTSHVQKLERQMGRRVLDRLPHGVQTTDLGSRLVPLAEAMLATEDRIRALPVERTQRPAGTVRVMAPESLCTYRLPAIVSAVRAVEPLVQVWVSPGGIGMSLDAVSRATVDIALTMEPRLPPTNLTVERLGAEPLVFLEQPTIGTAEATWSDLARRDVLLVEEGCGYSDVVSDRLAATGSATGRCSRFGSIEAIKRCVAAGLGWTTLPALATDAELRDGTLQVIAGPHLPACEVFALTHPRRHLGPATGVVLTEIRKAWSGAASPQ